MGESRGEDGCAAPEAEGEKRNRRRKLQQSCLCFSGAKTAWGSQRPVLEKLRVRETCRQVWGALTLLNRTLPNQNLLYRKLISCTLLNQETAKTYSAKPYSLLSRNLVNHNQESVKPYSAKQESAKTQVRNLLNLTFLNRNLLKQTIGIC